MRLRFGAFLAPHHPVGEHPMLQFRRDLAFVEHLDRLGYDEFWCGEHHSSGWEMIASPELFLAAVSERTKRIRLGAGVVHRSDWFSMHEAQLQLLPLQDDMPMAAASIISPSGMQLAGKYGMGVLSIASMSVEGLQALPLQWSFAEEAARQSGKSVDRRE
jgi:alkanesulfonate monooxygenase SsuD/methylene tetrahydromethanopterin reductase-like flavin-dependent oxidoreductase (luciferase family)